MRDLVRTYVFSFFSFIDTLFLLCDSKHCIYDVIYIYIYDEVVIIVLPPIFTCVVSFLSMYTWFLLIVCNLLFLSHTKMSWGVLFKCFRNIGCQSLLAINSLLINFFKSLCYDRFYCIQQVSMSWVIYDFSHMFICLLWFCHGLPKGEIVRTYVNHVRNIC